jgi:hypothetical protein
MMCERAENDEFIFENFSSNRLRTLEIKEKCGNPMQ